MKPILIVEDEAIMRDSLRDWLKDGGYDVETAEHGEDALTRIGEVDYGLVVLDLKLPGKDGLKVLKEAKEQRPQLKGIIITAYPTIETAVEAMKSGALDYLVKPVDPNALEKLIQETLGSLQVEIKPVAPVIEQPVAPVVEPVAPPAVEEVKKIRNIVFTKFHNLCTICHYAGYSDYCNFLQNGKCLLHEGVEESKRLRGEK